MKKGYTEARTLIVNNWSSECGNCGKDCDPSEKTHETNLGYDEKTRAEKGCGIKWLYIYSPYGDKGIAKKLGREDLQEIQTYSRLHR